ncbi:hypothetical protein [Calothrix sp. PCC 7507]|uniref:hypothetical protein n=1 Tax=Calothrix sp. PCC 7507 TaxID=99598 RepID=UPI00029F3533|nr:hypothetical protein [Calothrix sp. PCC 7507]AFY36165.1 hypothetical protein Cal7507_5851 [Calothrix sp. PCC 7507]
MAVARKSAVSAKGTWFRRDSTLSLDKGRSTRLMSATQRASTLSTEPSPVPSKRQRRSSKNLSISATNQASMSTSVSSVKEQSSAASKSPKLGFLNLPMMPSSGAAPMWLLRFYTLHRYSSVTAFVLVAITLVVYGWTVYSQELWGQGYRRVQNLQRQERQLTTTNAALKHKMAEDAEQPTAGLESPTPAKTIFLSPADRNSNSVSPSTTPKSEVQEPISPRLGY